MNKNLSKLTRKNKTTQKIKAISHQYRLSVFRSNRNIYCQIIDDIKGKTVLDFSTKKLNKKGKKVDLAKEVGNKIASLAKSKNINNVIFDRGSYKYHGQIKSLAEGARNGGLKF